MLTIKTELGDRRLVVEIKGPNDQPEPVTFIVGPQTLGDFVQAMDESRVRNFRDKNGLAGGLLMLVNRITGWEGPVDEAGQPLPCTPEMKELFFGQYPGALLKINQQLIEAEASESKNSGTSPAG